MEFKFQDSHVYTEKEKKYYTTSLGERVDFTWKPAILDLLFKEYSEIQAEIYNGQQGYIEFLNALRKKNKVDPEDEATIKAQIDLIANLHEKGDLIIITALKANGIEKTPDWLTQFPEEERSLMIRLIMDALNPGDFPEIPKKKNK